MDIKDIQTDLKKQKLSGIIFTLGNLFIGEDILPEENCICALTGFTGSYAILFIAPEKTYLFVDGRYELQAKKEINLRRTEIVKLSEISFSDWLKKHFTGKKADIAYNPWTLSLHTLKSLQKLLPNITFTAMQKADKLLSANPVKTFTLPKKFTGRSGKEKIAAFSAYLKKCGLDAFLITSAANVSWLLNLRSNALSFTPVFRAYALVEKSGICRVFAENTDYKEAQPFSELARTLPRYAKLGIDSRNAPAIATELAPQAIDIPDIITEWKAVKNSAEQKGMKAAHLRDGVALSKFIFWLSKNYKGKTEADAAQKLHEFRSRELNFISESFATISGCGENAAIVHYHAPDKNAPQLKKNSVLLLDSGGQYFDGTTDVTRTIAIGTPSGDMIEKNTLVLKAHIALATAVFPKNTTGSELDLIARQPLLKKGLDYAHGTGHGVGFCSDVHEGPARISISAKKDAPLQDGMITSIEPGYYKENAFGIRIENLYLIKATKNPDFLHFEVLTFAPIDKKLINKYLLTEEELDWLNNYHRQVYLNLKKYLTRQELTWLKEACEPL